MSELTARCLDTFPLWLRSLGDDASGLATLLGGDALGDKARRHVAGGLNYLFKSLDLIPDGIEDLGYLDDAFVLRLSAAYALAEAPPPAGSDAATLLGRLAGEAALIDELLGDVGPRLRTYVRGLVKGAARGRTVEEIVSDRSVCSAFVSEVHGWARGYEAPAFTRDDKTLVTLHSFLATRLPA